MDAIKILLFDVDGVLVNGGMFSKALAQEYGITPEKLTPFFQDAFLPCLIGRADIKEVITPYLNEWGWTGSTDEFLAYWFQKEHIIDESLVAYVQTVRQQGIPCYIATQQEKYRTAYILEKMGFAEAFDGMFSSAHVGYMKNTPLFFERILQQLENIQAKHILFWDDSQRNIVAAKEAGLQAELYTDFADFQQKMLHYSLQV